MAISIGMGINLNGWRDDLKKASTAVGQNLNEKSLARFDLGLRRIGSRLGAGMLVPIRMFGSALSSAFSPLLGLAGGALTLGALTMGLRAARDAAREFGDSRATLDAALDTLTGIDTAAARKEVESLGRTLQLALGIPLAETNKTFGDFVTRGFDLEQARQLTVLSANYARKSGKPLADVARAVGDAANGSVEAMKILGVQVVTTGNRVNDAKAAVLALKAAYGDVGTDLVNPSDHLRANINALAIDLGQVILPILEPLVQGAADFAAGLAGSEEGRQVLEKIGTMLGSLMVRIVSFPEMLIASWDVITIYLERLVNDIMAMIFDKIDILIGGLPGGQKLLDAIGLDAAGLTTALDEQSAELTRQLDAAAQRAIKAKQAFSSGLSQEAAAGGGGILGFFDRMIKAGAEKRQQATQQVQQYQAKTKDETFAGKPAVDREREKAAQALQKRATGFSGVPNVTRVGVTIVSAERTRFARM